MVSEMGQESLAAGATGGTGATCTTASHPVNHQAPDPSEPRQTASNTPEIKFTNHLQPVLSFTLNCKADSSVKINK